MRTFAIFGLSLVLLTGCESSRYYQTHRAPPPKIEKSAVSDLLPKDAEKYGIKVSRSAGTPLPIFSGDGLVGFVRFGVDASTDSARRGTKTVLGGSEGRPVIIIYSGDDPAFTAKAIVDSLREIKGASCSNLHIVYSGSRKYSSRVEEAVRQAGAHYYFDER